MKKTQKLHRKKKSSNIRKTQKLHKNKKSSNIRKTRKLQKGGIRNPFKALYNRFRTHKHKLSELPQQGTKGRRYELNSYRLRKGRNSETHLVPVNAGNHVSQTAIQPENRTYEKINSKLFTKTRNSERASERTLYENTSTSEPPLPDFPTENQYELAGTEPATYEVVERENVHGAPPVVSNEAYDVVESETGSRKKGLTRTPTVHIKGTVVYEEGKDSNEQPSPIVAEALYAQSTKPKTEIETPFPTTPGVDPEYYRVYGYNGNGNGNGKGARPIIVGKKQYEEVKG